jgi:hypothetical protein
VDTAGFKLFVPLLTYLLTLAICRGAFTPKKDNLKQKQKRRPITKRLKKWKTTSKKNGRTAPDLLADWWWILTGLINVFGGEIQVEVNTVICIHFLIIFYSKAFRHYL